MYKTVFDVIHVNYPTSNIFPPVLHPKKISSCDDVPKERRTGRIGCNFLQKRGKKRTKKGKNNCSMQCRERGASLWEICTLIAPDLHNFPWSGILCYHMEQFCQPTQLCVLDYLQWLLWHKWSRFWILNQLCVLQKTSTISFVANLLRHYEGVKLK